MRRSKRTLFAVLWSLAIPLFVVGCPKKKEPPKVEEPTPTPSPTAELVLGPQEEDAGPDAADADAGKKPTGPGMNPLEAKIRGCCNAINGQLKLLGNAPEANMLKQLVGTCYATASAVGKNPNAPEVQQLRSALAGKPIPGCSF